jgi:hypothetical protein
MGPEEAFKNNRPVACATAGAAAPNVQQISSHLCTGALATSGVDLSGNAMPSMDGIAKINKQPPGVYEPTATL